MEKSKNVEILSDYDDFVMFKTTCACNSDDHTLSVIVEKGSDLPDSPIQSSIYFKVSWRETFTGNIFQKIADRLKAVFNILFKGYLELDEEFLFRDDNHFKNFRDVLEEAINQVERNKENNI